MRRDAIEILLFYLAIIDGTDEIPGDWYIAANTLLFQGIRRRRADSFRRCLGGRFAIVVIVKD
jgi:hypothetical protein